MGERNYWMIGADGKSYGPADESTILRWIGERRLTANTQVSASAEGPWRDASSYPEFTSAFGVAPAPQGSVAFAAPAPSAPPPEPTPAATYPATAATGWPPANLQTALLIGAIFNILSGAYWLFAGLCCCCLGIPMILVGIMQCVDYAAASTTTPARYCERAQTWGIVNVCTILLCNIPSAICGILQLCWVGDVRRKYSGS